MQSYQAARPSVANISARSGPNFGGYQPRACFKDFGSAQVFWIRAMTAGFRRKPVGSSSIWKTRDRARLTSRSPRCAGRMPSSPKLFMMRAQARPVVRIALVFGAADGLQIQFGHGFEIGPD